MVSGMGALPAVIKNTPKVKAQPWGWLWASVARPTLQTEK